MRVLQGSPSCCLGKGEARSYTREAGSLNMASTDMALRRPAPPTGQAFLWQPNLHIQETGKSCATTRAGSLCLDLTKGVWHDHEVGKGGGALDLVEREQKLKGKDAIDWLRREGLLSDDAPRPNGKGKSAAHQVEAEGKIRQGLSLSRRERRAPDGGLPLRRAEDLPPAQAGRTRRLDMDRQGRQARPLSAAGAAGAARQRHHDRRGREGLRPSVGAGRASNHPTQAARTSGTTT